MSAAGAPGLPTPVYLLGTVAGNELYVKRDDLIPFSFGGNKARKAQLFFGEIDRGGYDCVVTYGSGSSNHGRIVSNMCAARGVPCVIISPLEASAETFNRKLMDLFGAKIVTVPVSEVHDVIEKTLEDLKLQGKKPYFIPGGGHGDLGTEAYVRCSREIRAYEKENALHFDCIFFASGTGTTQAGLICGQILDGEDRRIVGISIARKNPRGRQIVLDSVRSYLISRGVAPDEELIEKSTLFIDDFTADGYGKESPEIRRTIVEAMTLYGLPLDSTYTGKAFCGMRKYLEKNKITGKKLLFLHTGGAPLFFGDLSGL